MARPSLLLALTAQLFCASWAVAQNDPDAGPSVSAEMKSASLPIVLKTLCTKAGVKFRFDPGAEEALKDKLVTFSFTDVPLGRALVGVIRAAGPPALPYDLILGVYVFHAGKTPVRPRIGGPGPVQPVANPREGHIDKRISIKLIDLELGDALRALFDHVGANYGFPRVSVASGKIKIIEAVDAPFETVLGRVLSQVKTQFPLEFEVHDGIYMIGRGFGPPPPPFSDAPNEGPLKIDLHVKDADLRYALKALFLTIRANYAIDQTVSGKVTVDVRNAELGTAINMLLKAAKPAMPYSVEFGGGSYRITLGVPSGK
jgi:hypothetical protein